jgi:putative transposase
MVTDKLGSYAVAGKELMPEVEHRRHRRLNNRAENSHQPVRRRERIMKRFKSPRQLQRFVSIHDPIANLFHQPRHRLSSAEYRHSRNAAMATWREIARVTEA